MENTSVFSFTIQSILKGVSSYIHSRDARILLKYVMGISSNEILAYPESILTTSQIEHYFSCLARYLQGEPIAYIKEQQEFYGLTFKVTPAVLIPRPETEILVEQALSHIPKDQCYEILDIGTGSGCIAIAIAKERPLVNITAVDISQDALEVARLNADLLLGNSHKVRFLLSNGFEELKKSRYHIMIANPPYISEGDTHLTGLKFEPESALISGPQGLDMLTYIIQNASSYLHPEGWLLCEHGYHQSEAVTEYFSLASFQNIQRISDLSRIQRIVKGQKKINSLFREF